MTEGSEFRECLQNAIEGFMKNFIKGFLAKIALDMISARSIKKILLTLRS